MCTLHVCQSVAALRFKSVATARNTVMCLPTHGMLHDALHAVEDVHALMGVGEVGGVARSWRSPSLGVAPRK